MDNFYWPEAGVSQPIYYNAFVERKLKKTRLKLWQLKVDFTEARTKSKLKQIWFGAKIFFGLSGTAQRLVNSNIGIFQAAVEYFIRIVYQHFLYQLAYEHF